MAVLLMTSQLALNESAHAATTGETDVGTLVCDVTSKVSAVLNSHADVYCRFTQAGDSQVTTYIGRVIDHNIDYGEIEGGQMSWEVWGQEGVPVTLVDAYRVGPSAKSSSAGGAKPLIGQSKGDVLLVPQSLPGRGDVNFAAGVTSLTLRRR
jgi:hypothetical protein